MANKALAKRQKLTIRVEPSQRALKPRNPVAPAAKQRVAGGQRKPQAPHRQLQQRLMKSLLDKDEDK